MKSIFYTLAFTAVLVGCSSPKHQKVEPLPVPDEVAQLSNCTVPACFSYDNFNWRGDNLTLKVYNMDLYDAVEVNSLAVGDTLVWEGEPVVIETLATAENGAININEGEDGNPCLIPSEGGTYRGMIWDDHATYTFVGEKEVMLNQDFVINDCGENPSDSSVVVTEGQKAYLESLPESRQSFNNLNTQVVIEDGYVIEIDRRWIP